MPFASELGDALIGRSHSQQPLHSELVPETYGIIAHENRLFVGRGVSTYRLTHREKESNCIHIVITFYLRSTGKVGVHGWLASTTSIGHISYMVVQVYEHVLFTRFRAVHGHVAALWTHSYLHMSSDHFLLQIRSMPLILQKGEYIELDSHSYDVYRKLDSARSQVTAVVTALTKARRARPQANEE